MSDWRNPKTSERSVRSFAYKALRRLHALGARSHTIEDVEQELWLSWCVARDGYDPENGAAFQTYLYTSMQRHMNRYIERNFERFHGQTVALSLDAHLSYDDQEGNLLGGAIADENAIDAQLHVERESAFNYACSRLSDRARVFIQVLRDQPQEILQEMLHLDAKAQHARALGVTYAQPSRLTTGMVFDLMDAPRQERTNILRELTQLGALMTR